MSKAGKSHDSPFNKKKIFSPFNLHTKKFPQHTYSYSKIYEQALNVKAL